MSSSRCNRIKMDDFIESMLKERRGLEEALADLIAKYNRIPPNNERRALERMIEGLKAEIAVRSILGRAR